MKHFRNYCLTYSYLYHYTAIAQCFGSLCINWECISEPNNRELKVRSGKITCV